MIIIINNSIISISISFETDTHHFSRCLVDARVTKKVLWSAFQGGRRLAACLFVSERCLFVGTNTFTTTGDVFRP